MHNTENPPTNNSLSCLILLSNILSLIISQQRNITIPIVKIIKADEILQYVKFHRLFASDEGFISALFQVLLYFVAFIFSELNS